MFQHLQVKVGKMRVKYTFSRPYFGTNHNDLFSDRDDDWKRGHQDEERSLLRSAEFFF